MKRINIRRAVHTYLSENKDKNHTDEETGLLCCSSHTSVTYNTNGKTGSQSRQADRQTSSQVYKAPAEREIDELQ